MYTLYYAPGAASLCVHWMLIEIGAPVDLVMVDLDAKQQKSPQFLAMNPSGMGPTLIVDGEALADAAALLMLLAERHPEKNLAPAPAPAPGSADRAGYLRWMVFMANTLQPAFRACFYPDEPAGPDNAEIAKASARSRIEEAFARLDDLMADGRRYLIGETLSAADFLALMLMRWARNMPRPATDRPRLRAYADRLRALPSFLVVSEREQLTAWDY